jgi:hypothetical protein
MRTVWLLLFALVACSDRTPETAQPDAGSPGGQTPCVYGVSPARGAIGTEVTLTGEFGDARMPIQFWDLFETVDVDVQSWSPSRVVLKVPNVAWGSWSVRLPGGCVVPPAPWSFEVTPPSRIYIDNNVNNADGFDTITTMAYDPATGALKQLGPPTSTGLPATGRTGCSRSLALGPVPPFLDGSPMRLYVSGNTGVAALEIDRASGALRLVSSAATPVAGSTGFTALRYTSGYAWAAANAGIVAWANGVDNRLAHARKISTAAATDFALVGAPPSRLYAARGDGTFDAWSIAYESDPANGFATLPVLTALGGSPFGGPAGPPLSLPAQLLHRVSADGQDLLYVSTSAGLGLWRIDPAGVPTEVGGSPFALGLPAGTPSSPLFADPGVIYIAGTGSSSIAAAVVDRAGVPSSLSGSPWSLAPGVTNISCAVLAPGRAAHNPRLIVSDAGHRRLGVFEILGDAPAPAPVAGSPFAMTDTPADLAAGLVVLGGS